MDPYLIIISLAIIIIISHFLNVYSDNTGVPSVLILILFGFLLQLDTEIMNFEILGSGHKKSLLKILGGFISPRSLSTIHFLLNQL